MGCTLCARAVSPLLSATQPGDEVELQPPCSPVRLLRPARCGSLVTGTPLLPVPGMRVQEPNCFPKPRTTPFLLPDHTWCLLFSPIRTSTDLLESGFRSERGAGNTVRWEHLLLTSLTAPHSGLTAMSLCICLSSFCFKRVLLISIYFEGHTEHPFAGSHPHKPVTAKPDPWPEP